MRDSALQAFPDIEAEDLSIALKHVHNLEPTGVGARDVAECLELQLRALPASVPYRDAAMTLVARHLDTLASRDSIDCAACSASPRTSFAKSAPSSFRSTRSRAAPSA